MSEVVDISPVNLDSSLGFIQPSISDDVHCIKVKCAGWHYTALTYSFPNLEPVCCSMSGSNCYFLTCIQVSQETGKVVWYSHLFKNFLQFVVIHIVKGFSIVNEADVFLEFSYFFYDPTDVGNLISGGRFLNLDRIYSIWVHAIDWLTVSPQTHRLNSDLQSQGIWRGRLWEVIRSWGWRFH